VLKVARSAGVLLLAGLVVLIVFLIYFRYRGAAWLARKLEHEVWRTGWRKRIAALLEGFCEGLQGIRTWADLATLSFYTLAHWALVVLVYVWVLGAFPGKLSALGIGSVVLVAAFTLIGSAAQAPAVGGGSQAATFLVLSLIFGVEKEPAAIASIVLWLVTFAACCIAGLPLLFREGWSMGELRRMARAQEQAGEAELLAGAGHTAEPRERPR